MIDTRRYDPLGTCIYFSIWVDPYARIRTADTMGNTFPQVGEVYVWFPCHVRMVMSQGQMGHVGQMVKSQSCVEPSLSKVH